MMMEKNFMVLPVEGVFHNLVIVKIKKEYPGQASKVMHSLWGAGQMMFTKIMIVVDGDVNIHNTDDVAKYISDNNLTATYSGSGLYYVISTQGTGVQPNASSAVTVKYDGFLLNGTPFDSSPATGATFNLSGVIKGWQEGLTYFKKGGKGVLLIPSALGYGSQQTGSIPPNSVLVFKIELLDVK